MKFSDNPQNWRCALYWNGVKVPGSDTQFPSGGPSGSTALMQFNPFPSDVHATTFQLRIGRDNGGSIDPNTLIPVILPDESEAMLDCRDALDYAQKFGWVWAGAFGGGIAYPHAANLLRLFIYSNPALMDDGYLPDGINSFPFSCLDCSSYFNDWLSHNAGAPFDLSGNVTLTEWIFNADNTYGKMAAEASQMRQREQDYFYDNISTDLLIQWGSEPAGYSAWLPDWYEIGPWVDNLTDPNNGDLYFTFGEVRVLDHQVQYHAKKTGPSTVIIDGYRSKGVFIDLYDFSITASSPGDWAAECQLGYGNGNKDVSTCQIFRERVYWDKLSPPP